MVSTSVTNDDLTYLSDDLLDSNLCCCWCLLVFFLNCISISLCDTFCIHFWWREFVCFSGNIWIGAIYPCSVAAHTHTTYIQWQSKFWWVTIILCFHRQISSISLLHLTFVFFFIDDLTKSWFGFSTKQLLVSFTDSHTLKFPKRLCLFYFLCVCVTFHITAVKCASISTLYEFVIFIIITFVVLSLSPSLCFSVLNSSHREKQQNTAWT